MNSVIIYCLAVSSFGFCFCSDVPCEAGVLFEEIECGNRNQMFAFCQTLSPALRLISVHLKQSVRHSSNCQVSNFGLTSELDRVWVQRWCYGTFLVCFEPETTHESTHDLNNQSGDVPITSTASPGSTQSNKTRHETVTDAQAEISQKTTEEQSIQAMTSASPTHKITKEPIRYPQGRQNPLSTNNLLIICAICVIGLLMIAIILGALITLRKNKKGYKQRHGSNVMTSQTDMDETQPSVYDTIPFDKVPALPVRQDSGSERSNFQKFSLEEESPSNNGYALVGMNFEVTETNRVRNIYSHASCDVEYDRISQSGKRFHRSSSTYSHTSDVLVEPVYNEPVDSTIRVDTLESVTEHEYASVVVTERPEVKPSAN